MLLDLVQYITIYHSIAQTTYISHTNFNGPEGIQAIKSQLHRTVLILIEELASNIWQTVCCLFDVQ